MTDVTEDPTWTCPAGTIVGYRDGAILRASGIPYATTTRFAPPAPVLDLPSPYVATEPAPVFPQLVEEGYESLYKVRGRDVVFDEDCTRLTVTTPVDATPDSRLPVMVWIHGGSYLNGAGDLDAYDTRTLVEEHGVVTVAVTYRLGLLGYLARGDASPANLGLLDQVAAVQWVARNIASFGGDPDNVTLFGESAGADAIAHLMVAEGARGLFRRAILQSPPLGSMSGRDAVGAAMASAVGELSPDADWDVLRERQDAAHAAASSFGLASGMPYAVQYGHHPLPAEADLDVAWREAAREVDLLIGSTSREGALFVDDLPQLRRLLASRVVKAPAREAGVTAVTQLVFARPIRAFAHRHHQAGGHGYRYVLDWGTPGNEYRSAHTAELPLLLGTRGSWDEAWVARGKTADDLEVEGRPLRALWAEFARTGRLRPQRTPGLIDLRPLD